jgi:hypothetical protein
MLKYLKKCSMRRGGWEPKNEKSDCKTCRIAERKSAGKKNAET